MPTSKSHAGLSTPPAIYFSDVFGVAKADLEEYGAFNVSLVNDLPLFIDPFLLFHSSKPEYRALHEEIIRYMVFLRDKSIGGHLSEDHLKIWFMFPEVKENWLGFSKVGNKGRGLGMDFARSLTKNLTGVFRTFGNETVGEASHIEKLCLLDDGVGRDNISDFATNLLKRFLLEYTEAFAAKHVAAPHKMRVVVPKVSFNYKTEAWESRSYVLPFVNGEHIILTPIDLLTKDATWINQNDLFGQFSEIVDALDDGPLRVQLSGYFEEVLEEIRVRDEAKKAREVSDRQRRRKRRRRRRDTTQSQREEAIRSAIESFPQLLDYYVKWKEERGELAEAQADERVRSSERLFVSQVADLANRLRLTTSFYELQDGSYAEARQRALFLKSVIEDQDGWRTLWLDGMPIAKEADLHIMFRLTWCGTLMDVNREVNNGRGPADFVVSFGRLDKTVIEFKLASNSSLAKNLQNQTEIYQKAGNAQRKLKVIVYFSDEELATVNKVLHECGLDIDDDIILVDARSDNKKSASKATSHT